MKCPSCHRSIDPRNCVIIKRSMRGGYIAKLHSECWEKIAVSLVMDDEYYQTLAKAIEDARLRVPLGMLEDAL